MTRAASRIRIIQMRELFDLGISRRRMSDLLGISYANATRLCRVGGIPKRYDKAGWAPVTAKSRERATTMAALYRDGYTLERIGKQFGVTRERVRQLMTKHFGIRSVDGGWHRIVIDKRQRASERREDECLRKNGCTVEQWRELLRIGDEMVAMGRGRYRTPTYAFRSQRNNAALRGIGWELTLWQWWCIWKASGRWDQRGRGHGYVMCRIGDTGPYAVGNVFIATAAENSSEGQRKKRLDPSLPIGVSRADSGKYTAHRGKRSLGTYDTPELARAAYLRNDAPPVGTRKRSGLPPGVYKSRMTTPNPFRAYIYIGSKQKHVGCFATAEQAHAAHLQAKAALAQPTAFEIAA